MLNKFLKEAIFVVIGKQAEEIVDILNTPKHVNEWLFAKKLDITVNQARNILYKLSDQGLVSFIRKKDKKKGWYTYSWKIEVIKVLEFLRRILLKRIDQFKHQIKSRETKRFYVCERCNLEISEENALFYNFTCNECGDIFVMKDNTKILRDYNRLLERIEKELELIEEEIRKENEKRDKVKFKEIKKLEKIAFDKKELKRLARKDAKKKTIKKKVVKKIPIKKKTIKKKVVKKIPIKKKTIKKKVVKKIPIKK